MVFMAHSSFNTCQSFSSMFTDFHHTKTVPTHSLLIQLYFCIFTLADLGGMPGTCPPMGPNSFIFAENHPRRRSMPPLMGPCPPMGNPGSALTYIHFTLYHFFTNGQKTGYLPTLEISPEVEFFSASLLKSSTSTFMIYSVSPP